MVSKLECCMIVYRFAHNIIYLRALRHRSLLVYALVLMVFLYLRWWSQRTQNCAFLSLVSLCQSVCAFVVLWNEGSERVTVYHVLNCFIMLPPLPLSDRDVRAWVFGWERGGDCGARIQSAHPNACEPFVVEGEVDGGS